MHIFSVDAEVDGLYGRAFAIAVTVRIDGREVAKFEGRTPDSIVADSWVRENVLPAIASMAVTHDSSDALEEAFWSFWLAHREGVTVIAHCGTPVESGLFRRCVERDLDARKWQGPYPCLHDVGTLLMVAGDDPSSVDKYLAKHAITVTFAGAAHHPMYDALAAALAWERLMI